MGRPRKQFLYTDLPEHRRTKSEDADTKFLKTGISWHEHPRVERFADAIGTSMPCAFGMISFVWMRAFRTPSMQYGNISGASVADVARWCGWKKDPQVLYDALVQAELIELEDGQSWLGCWWDIAGDYLIATDRKCLGAKGENVSSGNIPENSSFTPSISKSLSSTSRDHVCNWDQGEAPAAPEVATQLASPLASPLPPIALDRDPHEPCQTPPEPEVVEPIVEPQSPGERRALTVASCDIGDMPTAERKLAIPEIWQVLVNDLHVANGVFPRADVLKDLREICGMGPVTKRDVCIAYLGAAGWQREQSGSSRVHVRTVVSFLRGNVHQEHKPPQPHLPDDLLAQADSIGRAAPRLSCQEQARQRAIMEAGPSLKQSQALGQELLAEERAARQKAKAEV